MPLSLTACSLGGQAPVWALARSSPLESSRMRIGTVVPMADGDAHEGTPDWDEIRRFAQHAESVDVDSLWVFDHMYSNVPGTEPRGVHEAWSLLTALAVATEKVELGQLVMCASFRPPAVLAKMAVTTDQISGGRLAVGVGGGWRDQGNQP